MLMFVRAACQTRAIIVAGNGLVLAVAQISRFTSSPTVALIDCINKINNIFIQLYTPTLNNLFYKYIQFAGLFHWTNTQPDWHKRSECNRCTKFFRTDSQNSLPGKCIRVCRLWSLYNLIPLNVDMNNNHV